MDTRACMNAYKIALLKQTLKLTYLANGYKAFHYKTKVFTSKRCHF